MVRRPPLDLLIVVGVAALALVATLASIDRPVLRALVGVPAALVAPGYALSRALFPIQSGRTERLLSSLGLSLAIAALGGLALNVTPWAVTAPSWAAFLFCVTLGASIVGSSRTYVALADGHSRSRIQLDLPHIGTVGVAVMILGAAFLIARSPAPQLSNHAYTMLWAVPADVSQPNTIRLGVTSMEASPTAYIVKVTTGEQALHDFPIELAPAGAWEAELELLGIERDRDVQVLLYRADAPDTIYRHVALRARTDAIGGASGR